MGMTEALKLLISADTAGAVREIQKVGRTADRDLGRTEERAKKMSASFVSAGTKMMAGGGAAAFGLVKAAGAADDLGDAVAQSETIFGGAAAGLDKWAKNAVDSLYMTEQEALDFASNFGRVITAWGVGSPEAAEMSQQLVEMGNNFSAIRHEDPSTTMTKLTAAVKGSKKAALEFGLSLDTQTVKQKAVEMGLASSTDSVTKNGEAQARLALLLEKGAGAQGKFAAQAGDFDMQMRHLKASLGQAEAELGTAMIPSLNKATGLAASAVGAFNDLPPPLKEIAGDAIVAGTGLTLLGGGALTAVGWVLKLKTSAADSGASLAKWWTTMKAGEGVMTGMRGGLKQLTTGFSGGAIALGLGTTALTMWMAAVDKAKQEANEWGDAYRTNVLDQIAASEDPLKTLSAGIADANAKSDEFATSLSKNPINAEYNVAMRQAAANSHQLAVELRGVADQQHGLAVETGISSEMATKWLLTQKTAGVTFASTADAVKAYKAAQDDSTSATDDGIITQKEQTQALEDQKKAWDDAVDSISAYYDKTVKLLNANLGLESGLDEVAASVKEHGHDLNIDSENGRANIETIRDVAGAIFTLAEEYKKQGDGNDVAAAKTKSNVARLRDQMLQAGYTTDAVDGLIQMMGLTPPQIDTRVNAVGLIEARTGLDDVKRKADNLDGRTVTITVKEATQLADAALSQAQADFDAAVSKTGGRSAGPGTVGVPTGGMVLAIQPGAIIVNEAGSAQATADEIMAKLTAFVQNNTPEALARPLGLAVAS